MKKKNVFRTVSLLVSLLMVFAFVAACAADPAPAPAPAPAAPAPEAPAPAPAPAAPEAERQFRVAVSLPPIQNAFHAQMRVIIDAAVAEAPDNFEFVVINALDDSDQVNMLTQWYGEGDWDLIGIMPNNGTLVTPIAERIFNSGVPTIVMNRNIESDVRTAFVTGDNFGGGYNAGRFIADFLGGEGTVAVLRSIAGTPIDMERMDGFNTAIVNYPGIEILVEGDGQFNREAGFEAMTNILAAFPHIDALYTQDDEAALGALTAIQGAGRTDIRIITGFGGTVGAFEIYQMADPDHILRATMSYFPTMGAEGIRQAIRYLQGESIPDETFAPSYVVTMDNVHEFMQYAY